MNEYSRKPSLDLMLSIITLGFYDFYLMYKVSADILEAKHNEDPDKLRSLKKLVATLSIISLIISIMFVIMWFKGIGNDGGFFFYEPILGIITEGMIAAAFHVVNITHIYKANHLKGIIPVLILTIIFSVVGIRVIGFMVCDSKLNHIQSLPQNDSQIKKSNLS